MFEHCLAALLRLGQTPDRHGYVALVKELLPQLDRELDAWEAAYGWRYR
jgi:hypothetical protein